jgi:hypothetical protein
MARQNCLLRTWLQIKPYWGAYATYLRLQQHPYMLRLSTSVTTNRMAASVALLWINGTPEDAFNELSAARTASLYFEYALHSFVHGPFTVTYFKIYWKTTGISPRVTRKHLRKYLGCSLTDKTIPVSPIVCYGLGWTAAKQYAVHIELPGNLQGLLWTIAPVLAVGW